MNAIFAVAFFEAIGQSLIAYAHKKKSVAYVILAMVSYCFVTLFLYIANHYKGVGMVNALWSGMSIILMIAIGRFFFAEKIKPGEWIGIGLILSGILLIQAIQD